MANLTPVVSNDNVFQLETTTPALGGPGQVMNSQAQSLLNRLSFESAARSTAEALLAPLVSPAFTGVPTGPTAAFGTNTTQLATTAFVEASDANLAPISSPTFTGTPAAPTAAPGTNTTQLATTAFATTADNLRILKTGDTMAGNLAMGGNEITGLPSTPSGNTAATSKLYVDGLITGLVWLNTIDLSNLIGTLGGGAAPGSPLIPDAYILDTTGSGTWAGFAAGDVVQYSTYSGSPSTPVWHLVKAAAIGDRFGISFQTATAATGDAAGKENYIGEITGGTAGAWTWTWTAPAAGHAVFVDNINAYLFGHSYTYVTSTSSWVEFSGPGATGAGDGLSYTGNTLNVNVDASSIEINADILRVKAAGITSTMLQSSPALAGTPTTPTAAPGTSTTQVASTAFVSVADALLAPLASPTFTGIPAAPTASLTTNTTQLATTAFVQSVVATSSFNAQVGTTYTFALSDAGITVTCTNASPILATIPLNSTVAFPVGSNIDVIQGGAGKVTFTPAGGVTLKSLAGNLSISGQNAGITLRKEATDTWYVLGALIA